MSNSYLSSYKIINERILGKLIILHVKDCCQILPYVILSVETQMNRDKAQLV